MELTEKNRAGDFILSMAPGTLSLENGILNSGQNLQAGTVLGELLTAGAATAVGSPTGNGVITVGAVGSDAVPGIYKLQCVAAATDAGTFNFYAPNGTLIRQITVGAGAIVTDHITITIADGATDHAAGDTYTITVSGGDYEALDVAEDDGAQIAAGVLYAGVDATDADTACVVLKRQAEVKADALVWPDGITQGQKDAAIAQLNSRGIFLR